MQSAFYCKKCHKTNKKSDYRAQKIVSKNCKKKTRFNDAHPPQVWLFFREILVDCQQQHFMRLANEWKYILATRIFERDARW